MLAYCMPCTHSVCTTVCGNYRQIGEPAAAAVTAEDTELQTYSLFLCSGNTASVSVYLPYSREELLQVSGSYPGCQLHAEHRPGIALLWSQVIYRLPAQSQQHQITGSTFSHQRQLHSEAFRPSSAGLLHLSSFSRMIETSSTRSLWILWKMSWFIHTLAEVRLMSSPTDSHICDLT